MSSESKCIATSRKGITIGKLPILSFINIQTTKRSPFQLFWFFFPYMLILILLKVKKILNSKKKSSIIMVDEWKLQRKKNAKMKKKEKQKKCIKFAQWKAVIINDLKFSWIFWRFVSSQSWAKRLELCSKWDMRNGELDSESTKSNVYILLFNVTNKLQRAPLHAARQLGNIINSTYSHNHHHESATLYKWSYGSCL